MSAPAITPMRRLTLLSLLVAALLTALAATLTFASPALATAWWRISARAAPTYLPPGGHGLIELSADDLGNSGISGASSPVTITDQLPAGLSVTEASAIIARRGGTDSPSQEEKEHWSCSVTEERNLSCSTTEAIPPYESLAIEVPVAVNEPPGTLTQLPNEASVQGGIDQGGAGEAGGGGLVTGASESHPLQNLWRTGPVRDRRRRLFARPRRSGREP